jgi:hypothetical protein
MLFQYRSFENQEQAQEPSLLVSNVNVTAAENLYWKSWICQKKVER